MSNNEHVPVLLGPVLEGLDIKKDGCYVDGTFGRGGHSGEILKRLNASGHLISIDRDPAAIASAPKALTDDPRFELIKGCCAQLETIIAEKGLKGQVDGILPDAHDCTNGHARPRNPGEEAQLVSRHADCGHQRHPKRPAPTTLPDAPTGRVGQ